MFRCLGFILCEVPMCFCGALRPQGPTLTPVAAGQGCLGARGSLPWEGQSREPAAGPCRWSEGRGWAQAGLAAPRRHHQPSPHLEQTGHSIHLPRGQRSLYALHTHGTHRPRL